MTGRKRVWAALQGGPLDRPPKGEILITPEIAKEFPCPDINTVFSYLNVDLVTLQIDQTVFEPSKWRGWAGEEYFIFGLLQGPITILGSKLGWHNFSRLLVKSPGEARDVMQKLVADGVKSAVKALEAGCDGIIVADDLAGNRGPLISPSFLVKNYFPLLAHMLQGIGHRQAPCIFHSDGYIMELVPHLREAGFRGIQGLQPSVGIRPESFRHQGLEDWVFWGNFEFEGSNGLKSGEEVKNQVNSLLKEWTGFTGYIFGSSGGLYKGLSPEIVKIAYDAVTSWRN